MSFAKISVVTPCYNHAPYLEETIQSVLGQGYPNLEYIIMDGGSTDGSVEIIQKYANSLAYWQSAPDQGMYHAINAGMARTTGDILAWLNSDDYYLPGTLRFAASRLDVSTPALSFGNVFHFVQGQAGQWGSDVQAKHLHKDLAKFDYIVQPGAFWTRRAWELAGALDESFQFVADWEWFARASRRGVFFEPHARYMAAYRITSTNKTSSGREPRWQEQARILREYVNTEYARVFEQMTRDRDKILRVRGFLRKWRLARLERPVFRAIYPGIFSHVSMSDAWDMVELIGYS